MLVLKVQRGERVKLFFEGHEIGWVSYDRRDPRRPAETRLIFDFDERVKIFRTQVIDRSDELRADLTFRGK
jgi:hypothetical protein